MASLLTCAVTGLTWCFCSACASLMSSCCGNDKPSTVPPGATSGRKRSVLVLAMSIGLALFFQWYAAPAMVDSTTILNVLRENWLEGCEEFGDGTDLQKSCVGNSANYRVSAATTIFFALAAVAAALKPTANREAWPAKYVLYFFLVGAMVFVPNEPFFAKIYLNIARVGGILFVLVQQLVIVDVAFNWNDRWVTRADAAEAEEPGSGQKWLTAILLSCATLFAFAIGMIIYMFVDFTGCGSNETFISLTLVFSLGVTAAQMSGEEGSLLSSACISAWAAFLCYTAVSKNPDATCNPRLGEPDPLNMTMGLAATFVSLAWAGWSYTAEDKLNFGSNADDQDEEEYSSAPERKVTGVVTGPKYGTSDEEAAAAADPPEEDLEPNGADPQKLSNSWKLNIALATVACWKAMILTHWGEIAANGTLANPSAGRIGMWMVIASQWLALTLYLWTLVAPRLFPDRDFS